MNREAGTDIITARVSPAEKAAIERLAAKNDRTASKEIRRAIRRYLADAGRGQVRR